MGFIKSAILGIVLGCLASCALSLQGRRLIPKYDGVAPKAEPYVKEWLELASGRGLKFDKDVSVGFTDIDQDLVVGLTNYGFGFTEIDLDTAAWNRFTEITKMCLVFHELSHAYCYRGHDYGPGKNYPKDEITPNKKHDGFFKDGCPLSLMYPYLLDDNCMTVHHSDYIKEMFNNCDPI